MFRPIACATLIAATVAPLESSVAAAQTGNDDYVYCNSYGDSTHAAKQVISACDRAIASQSLSTAQLEAAFIDRGNAYDDSGNHEAALADYNEALRLNPDDAFVYLNRGVTYQNTGRSELAIADFTKSISLLPNHQSTFKDRGQAYVKLGQYQLAIADYTEALRLKPDYADAYFNRGVAYDKSGDRQRAIADWDEAVRISPELAAEVAKLKH